MFIIFSQQISPSGQCFVCQTAVLPVRFPQGQLCPDGSHGFQNNVCRRCRFTIRHKWKVSVPVPILSKSFRQTARSIPTHNVSHPFCQKRKPPATYNILSGTTGRGKEAITAHITHKPSELPYLRIRFMAPAPFFDNTASGQLSGTKPKSLSRFRPGRTFEKAPFRGRFSAFTRRIARRPTSENGKIPSKGKHRDGPAIHLLLENAGRL